MNRPETVLYSSLTDVERLEYLAKEGIDVEIIPTASMRQVVEWALKYYFDSGCIQAPSREALALEWGHILEIEEVVLDDPDEENETIQWVLEYLKSTFLHLQWQTWSKTAAAEMASAPTDKRLEVFSEHTAELAQLSMKVRSRTDEKLGLAGFDDALRRYRQREALGGVPQGMMLGLPAVDEHTHGIHLGELAIWAGGPKMGKSYMLDWIALSEWRRGRRVVLNTLENSVDMTVDRLVCMQAGISSRRWQRGQCEPEEIARVEMNREYLAGLGGELIVVMPPTGRRFVDAIMQEAQTRDAQSLVIDQLSFMEGSGAKRKERRDEIAGIMRDLKGAISQGSYKLPCVLAHQINREGVKAAEKTDHLEMYMLAESSEVERTADWVFGLFRSDAHRAGDLALLQVLASRREDVTTWMLNFDPSTGLIGTIREMGAE